jgi:ABC-type branched-subunit amino acid transport system substrate-binding protein
MGIKNSALLLLLLLSCGIYAQQDTSRIYNWKGRQVRYLKIEKGKTLYSISKQYEVAQDTLISCNPGLENGLKTGMILRIPLPVKPPAEVVKTEIPATKKPALPVENKENKKPEKENKTETSVEKEAECKLPEKGFNKSELKIALFLPFYLSDDGKRNPKSDIGLDFYSGVRLALDSLSKSGISAKVYVFDTRNDTAAVFEALRKPECREADLIIGPLYTSGFKPVAEFARKNNICAISPFSQSDAILQSFANVVKITPDQESLLFNLYSKMLDKKPNANFVLLRNNNDKDKELANQLSAALKSKDKGKKIHDITLASAAALIDSLHEVKENIIFFPSSVQVQVIDLVARLSNMRGNKVITLVGLQEWNNYENIDFDQLNNLNYTYATSFFPDYEAPESKKFNRVFKDEFKAEPGSYAIQGYDVTLYFVGLAAAYGKDFYRCLEKIKPHCGLGACYSFTRAGKNSGSENQAIKIIRLDNYKATPMK